MSRIIVFFALALFSCQRHSDRQAQPKVDTVGATAVVTDNETISCEQLIAQLVKSSNAIAFSQFSDSLVQARVAYLKPDKLTIKLYVINDISETAAEKRLVEHAVGWLEFYQRTGQLLDITNDPEHPVNLRYDKGIVQGHNLFTLCRASTIHDKPGNGYALRDVMLEKDIKFNGKLDRFFMRSEFDKVFGRPDSIHLLKDEAPCITLFDTEAPDDKYLYKSGSRFETSGDSVAIEDFWFLNGNFISYNGIRIDANTTLEDIQQLFPTAVNERQGMDKAGRLWVIRLREDNEGVVDGHIRMYFKDGKAQSIHWWSPC
ncbi:hypothetical protein ACK8HY_01940 [Sphingobacterium sp. NGMCC 1.201703]|uniref:hypothetical protein n=1 Tax=Sphingobacterium sp. NGMCC 1.201703 TaxID=3388657 RepID=UPI0039FD4CAE